MRPLPAPFGDIVAGRPAPIRLTGSTLLGARMLTKELAFDRRERDALRLRGLLPDCVLTIEEQEELELEHLRRKSDDLERYIGLAALQDRNATLFYRLLHDHLEEFLPIVYTPTVGRACQEFSHIVRGTRGVWITPADRDVIPQVVRSAPYKDVRLIVVTDNERILGLGDQGAGGMPIPIGKLALYTAAAGIHPALTLPVSLDVGTDNPRLLTDPLYLGHRAPRLRGREYDELVEAFVLGVQKVWPGCLIQWEDFKQHNALAVLERYRDREPSFNDDIQGTAAVVVAGVLAAERALGEDPLRWRIVLVGAGAAGIGIARLLGALFRDLGADEPAIRRAVILVDSRGLLHAGRTDLDEHKAPLALPLEMAHADGFDLSGACGPGLESIIRIVRPTVLVGTTGVGGLFTEPLVRAMANAVPRPIVLPLSNPTANAEATPEQVLAWSGGRAIVATGSPFPGVSVDGCERVVGQANNVLVFPGLGLGIIASEARRVTDRMLLLSARTLASMVTAERLRAGGIYPRIRELGAISRTIALTVAREAVAAGVAGISTDSNLEAIVDAAIWYPAYVPYVRAASRAHQPPRARDPDAVPVRHTAGEGPQTPVSSMTCGPSQGTFRSLTRPRCHADVTSGELGRPAESPVRAHKGTA